MPDNNENKEDKTESTKKAEAPQPDLSAINAAALEAEQAVRDAVEGTAQTIKDMKKY